jgi:hypothetical protein
MKHDSKITLKTKINFKIYYENDKIKNKRFFEFALSIIIILNIILFLFLVVYKYDINKTMLENQSLNNKIECLKQNEKNITSINEKRMINLFVQRLFNNVFHYSFLLKNNDEINFIKQIVFDCNPKEEFTHTKYKSYLLYQSKIDGDSKKAFLDLINYWWNIIIIIETNSNKRFGVFIHSFITLSFKNIITDKNLLFFDLEKLETYKLKNDGENILEFPENNDIILKIGEDDLIIYENFTLNNSKSFSNFPKSFEFDQNYDSNINPLTNTKKGYFTIKNIEMIAITPPRDANY